MIIECENKDRYSEFVVDEYKSRGFPGLIATVVPGLATLDIRSRFRSRFRIYSIEVSIIISSICLSLHCRSLDSGCCATQDSIPKALHLVGPLHMACIDSLSLN